MDNGVVNIVKKVKLDPSNGLDLLFNCRANGNYILFLGVESYNKSVLYVFDRELNLVNKTIISDNGIWYTDFEIVGDRIFLVGGLIDSIASGYVIGHRIVLEERSFPSLTLVREKTIVNTMNSLYAIPFLDYNSVSNKFIVTVAWKTPEERTSFYMVDPDLKNSTKIFETKGYARLADSSLNGYMFIIALKDEKVYVLDSNGKAISKYNFTLSFMLRKGDKYIYQDGVYIPEYRVLALYGIDTKYNAFTGKTQYILYTSIYSLDEETGGLKPIVIGNSIVLNGIKYAMLNVIAIHTSGHIYVLFSGSNVSSKDYEVYIYRFDTVNIPESEIQKELQRFLNYKYGVSNLTNTINTNNASNNVKTNDLLFYYAIAMTLTTIGLIVYIIVSKRKTMK